MDGLVLLEGRISPSERMKLDGGKAWREEKSPFGRTEGLLERIGGYSWKDEQKGYLRFFFLKISARIMMAPAVRRVMVRVLV